MPAPAPVFGRYFPKPYSAQGVGHGAVGRCGLTALSAPLTLTLPPLPLTLAALALASVLPLTVLTLTTVAALAPAGSRLPFPTTTALARAATTFGFARTGFVIQPQRQTDALTGDVDLEHLHLDHVPRFHHLARVFHEIVRHGRNVHQTVLMHADVDERAERRDIGDHTLQHHARLQIGDLLHARGEFGGLEFRARVAAGLLQLADDVGDGGDTEALIGELHAAAAPAARWCCR